MSLSSHIDKFNKLITDLLNLDETFIDERKAMLLIGSLFDKLDYLCITLIHGKNKLSFEEVYSALLNYEIQKKDKKEHRDTSVEALRVRGRSQNKKLEKRGKVSFAMVSFLNYVKMTVLYATLLLEIHHSRMGW